MTEARALEGLDTEPAALDEVELVESPESNTPGFVLRRARESRGQSIADVVQVIRFSARQIEALERDDYASLPGSTAVRGLVRNYAKFLKLDAAPLLAQLDPAVPVPEADVRPPTNMGEAEHSNFIEQIPPKLIAVGVLLVVLVLAAYWYLTLAGNEGLTLRLLGTDGAVAVAPPSQLAAPAPAPVAVAPAPVPENQPESSSAVSGAPSSGGLRVEFDDRSWIEIRDATQKIVYVGEYPAGTRQNVEGKAPFQVWIGKASGVRLFMGERSIDLKPHTREEVARFSLE
ncbi:helix-turn-helix domain-containing protein [Sulfuritalea sp.]|uniref:helix-turn-helix domain-containing protein n=1 Tax=Sulfuritalea sp. TaxID=2480090 RepID=UPI00286D9FF8|nr:helix-turn-helix domain-containing protein [Sulfuritalea sp.]